MTTSHNDPLDPLGTTDQPVGEVTPMDPTPYAAGEYDSDTSAEAPSTTDTAKNEAKNVKDAAAGATQQVVGTAKEQAGQVVSDVRDQTRQLADQTRTELSSQAAGQRDKAVGGLRSLGDELRSMSDQGGQSGLATQLAREGAEITHKVADFIERREPAQLLDEVRSYARRKPGTFLIGAAVAGVVVGRLTRGVIANRSSDDAADGPSELGTGYTQTTPASYLGSPVESAAVLEVYTEDTPAYGSAQMDQLAYPAEAAEYVPEETQVTDAGAYVPEEPGPYDAAGEQSSATYPSDQGYRS
jgi:uncharacterized protein YjbJ (UPF0337 family)